MLVSSKKANNRAEAVVEFARRHRWAKYPCLAAVSVIYSADFLRIKMNELTERIKASSEESFRPFGKKVTAVFLSGAFAFMAVPFSAVDVSAAENDVPSSVASESEELPKPWTKLPPKTPAAATPEAIADRISMKGLAEEDNCYDIILNIRTLKKDVTADFTRSPKHLEQVITAFESYGIPTDSLNIQPVDVTLYTTDEKYILQLSEGYSADITFPIPEDMKSHLDDLKVIRLEDDGTIAILDCVVGKNKVSFNTEHFSVFALVAYKDPVPTSAENISAAAGMTASGTGPVAAVSTGLNVFGEDKNRFKKDKKRKVYRIKRIAKENQLLLL